jgi:hypothetical protein
VLGGLIAWGGSSALSPKTLAPERTNANLRRDVGVIKEHS